MTRSELLMRLSRGLNADLAAYGELKALLQAQFDAALRHETVRLAEISDAVTELAETLEARRRERVDLVGTFLEGDAEPSMTKVFASCPEAARAMLQGWWSELENLVRECKALSGRSCTLLVDQHEIMQRVLNGEANIYAPA
jgi:flagella synthesis protein FlgN